MTVDDPTDPKISDTDNRHHVLARRNRGIRFSDSEWDEVREAAQEQGITPAEFVRDEILHLVRAPEAAGAASLPADLAPLIERTFRYTHMLATRMRDELVEDGSDEAVETLIREARELQESLLGRPPTANRHQSE